MSQAKEDLFQRVREMRGRTGHDHYSETHRKKHCKCFRPEDWQCAEHDKPFKACGCTPPVK